MYNMIPTTIPLTSPFFNIIELVIYNHILDLQIKFFDYYGVSKDLILREIDHPKDLINKAIENLINKGTIEEIRIIDGLRKSRDKYFRIKGLEFKPGPQPINLGSLCDKCNNKLKLMNCEFACNNEGFMHVAYHCECGHINKRIISVPELSIDEIQEILYHYGKTVPGSEKLIMIKKLELMRSYLKSEKRDETPNYLKDIKVVRSFDRKEE